jgi:hypothetical protein
VFIIYYSMYGHVQALARAAKEGIDSVEGMEGVLYQVNIPAVNRRGVHSISQVLEDKLIFDTTGRWSEQQSGAAKRSWIVCVETSARGRK